jgi:hypothetical protein
MRKLIVLLCALAACGGEEAPKEATRKSPAPAPDAAWRMTADPGTAYSVADAKEELPTDEIVVVGRVHRMVNGFASFTLMDDKLDYCGEVNKADGCKTPWDYCCDTKEDRTRYSLNVQFEDANGKPARADLFGDLRLCDLVAVRGTVTKDEHGNVTVHAKQFFRKERPDLPDDVRWP